MKVFISNKEIEEIAYGLIQVTCGSHPAPSTLTVSHDFWGCKYITKELPKKTGTKSVLSPTGAIRCPYCAKTSELALSFPRTPLFWILFYSGLLKTAADGLFLPMKSAIFSSTGQTRFTIRPALTGNMTASANTAFESCKNG